MRKPPVDPTSEAFQTASGIIGDGKPSSKSPSSSSVPHSIEIAPSDNGGAVVTHMPKDTGKHGGGGGDYSKRQTNTFSDMASAHKHVGKLMGVGVELKGGGLK